MVCGGAAEPGEEGRETHRDRGGSGERACVARCRDSEERGAGPGGKGSFRPRSSGAQLGAAPAPSAWALGARHLPSPKRESG